MRQALLDVVSSCIKEIKSSESSDIPPMEGNSETETFIAALRKDLGYFASSSDRLAYLDEVNELLKAGTVQVINRHYM